MQQVDIYTEIVIASSRQICNYTGTQASNQPRRHGDVSYTTTRLISATKAKNYIAILLETQRLVILEDIICLEPKILTAILCGRNITDKNTSTINSAPSQHRPPQRMAVRGCPSPWRDDEGTNWYPHHQLYVIQQSTTAEGYSLYMYQHPLTGPNMFSNCTKQKLF